MGASSSSCSGANGDSTEADGNHVGSGWAIEQDLVKTHFREKNLIIPTKHMEFVSLYLTEITKQKSCLVVKQLTINCPESVKKRLQRNGLCQRMPCISNNSIYNLF